MTDLIADARQFAIQSHGDQRYGDKPYVYHLDAVASLLQPFGEEAQVAGYLHDVAEDTDTGIEAIAERFGKTVARFVALVTDEPGINRRDRKAKTNAKLSTIGPDEATALTIKAADRLANLRESALGGDSSKLSMYRREHAAFKLAAYRSNLCDDFWIEMDRLLDEQNGRD